MSELSTATLAAIAAGVFGVSVLALLAAMLARPRQRTPQDGQALGCLLIVAATLFALLALLVLGYWLDARWLVVALFGLALLPFLCGVGALVYNLLVRIRRRP